MFLRQIALIIACCLVFFIFEAMAAPACSQTRQHVDPLVCKHGTVEDWCRNTVCAKGPGEECGGEWDEHGRCGDGMYCACGTCTGCSTTLECFYGTFC